MNAIASSLFGAMDALRAAVPGCINLEIRKYATWSLLAIRVELDDEVSAAAAALDLGAVELVTGGDLRWLRARRAFDDGAIEIEVTGPRAQGPAPALDQRALDEAAEQARVTAATLGLEGSK